VPTIVATLWEVDDQLAHDVFTAFHRRVAESGNPAEAFATTQREFAEADRAGWSAFVVIEAAAAEPVLRSQPS
jgi:CHAT domain-containing protein